MNTHNKKLNVYIDTPYWYIRPKNTDWKYTLSLKGMVDYSPITISYSREISLVVEENLQWFKRKFFKSGAPSFQRVLETSAFPLRKPDIIYSHGRFPITETTIPVVWFNGVVDPAMRISSGISASAIEEQYNQMRSTFERAAIVLCPTQAFANRHSERFPNLSKKFQYAPFFLNHIKTITDTECSDKHAQDEEIRFLFVGREARRKGLDIVIEAFEKLKTTTTKKIELLVVTNDPIMKKKYGGIAGITWYENLPNTKTMDLMRKAHVFVMPSRYESYGLVYIEAMASGCAVIATPWESQVEIFDQGASGALSLPDIKSLTIAMNTMCDSILRNKIALNGLNKCRREYTPEAVSMLHHRLFSSAL